jgi:hypothetical protein
MKKKLESDVLDLETALEHANAANAETQVYVVQLHLLNFESVKWNLKAGQLLSTPMPPILRLRYKWYIR